ncbi:MAG: hypothetical protein NZO58_11440 [Gemmataceae bacterium]|nr:hypothetical protein [Gemmataceae bacterium]
MVSVGLAGHLLAIVALVLGAPSGPWYTQFGASTFPGPVFATSINTVTLPYLEVVRMTHNYKLRVDVNRPSVYFEAHLKDANGNVVKTVKVPDPKANFWVRHRQQLLADGLFEDLPVPPPGSERLGAPKKTYWEASDKQFVLKTVPEHLVPRNPPVMSPSPWSLLLAQSYMRYLCRTHRAASAELVRHSRDAVLPPNLLPPMMLESGQLPPQLFEEFVANFGVYRRDQ